MARTFDPEKSGFKRVTSVEPDNKGRVTLGKLLGKLQAQVNMASGRFAVYVNDAGQIVLDPTVEIPMREQWIYKNPKALKALQKGLISAVSKPLVNLGSFAKHAKDDADV